MIEKIADLVKEKKLEGIADIEMNLVEKAESCYRS
jgi:DNA gyrase/topoisomerase IV subunit A